MKEWFKKWVWRKKKQKKHYYVCMSLTHLSDSMMNGCVIYKCLSEEEVNDLLNGQTFYKIEYIVEEEYLNKSIEFERLDFRRII